MKNSQNGFANLVVISIVLAVVLGVGGYFVLTREREPVTQQTTMLSPTLVDETAGGKIYRNEKYGFEVMYAKNIFVEEPAEQHVPPSYKGMPVSGMKLSHTVPIEYCGAKGPPVDCSPITENMSIGFFPFEKKFHDVVNPIKDFFGGGVQTIAIGNRDGLSIRTGAEGEGLHYYFVPIDGDNTLMITRSYIDETNVTTYKNVDDFIPILAQEKLFTDLMTTFKFIE